MKAVFKICNMYSSKDVTKIKRAISSNEGIIACQIQKQNGEVEVVFDDYFVNEDKIIESIEDVGFTVI